MKQVFIDTETSGLDPKVYSILTLSGIICEDGKELDRFNYNIAPYRGEKFDENSSRVNGITEEIASSFPPQEEVLNQFLSKLEEYINPNDFNSRAFLVGYNVGFDLDFLVEWFNFNGRDRELFRYFVSPNIDVMTLTGLILMRERFTMRNFKLATVYRRTFGRDFDGVHNSMADIEATKELYDFYSNRIISSYTYNSVPVRKRRGE